jgi:hypothetical protein
MFQPLLLSLLPEEEPEQPRRKKLRTEEGASDAPSSRFPNIAQHCSTTVGESTAGSQREIANSVLSRMMKISSLGNDHGVKDSNRRKVYTFVREWGGVDDEDDE